MSFSEKTLDFLVENRFMDSKEWHLAHRQEYNTYVLEPLRQLCRDMAPYALKIDSQVITEEKVGKCLSRIYRDTRFTKDKSIFRSNMWIVYARPWRAYPYHPALVFEFGPDDFHYGMGYYEIPRPLLDTLRTMILEGDPVFLKAKKAFEKQKVYQMTGTMYKRSKFPDAPEDLRLWLDRKSLGFMHYSTDFDDLFSEDLAQKVGEDLLLLKPMYDFFVHGAQRTQAGTR